MYWNVSAPLPYHYNTVTLFYIIENIHATSHDSELTPIICKYKVCKMDIAKFGNESLKMVTLSDFLITNLNTTH